ncbi:MAG: alpha/beta hydrolase [Gemmatales bacterium]
MNGCIPPFLLSWAFPVAARMGWLTTTVTNPSLPAAHGLAYLFRGNGTIFTPGYGRLTDQLRGQGLWAEDLTCNGLSWAMRHVTKNHGSRPIILIGHSCGGRRCLRLATLLESVGISIDLLICIDVAFTQPVPTNVRKAIHLYRSQWRFYPARPLIPATGIASLIENIDLDQPHAPFPGTWLNHFNITGNEALQRWIINEVTQLLPSHVLPPSA